MGIFRQQEEEEEEEEEEVKGVHDRGEIVKNPDRADDTVVFTAMMKIVFLTCQTSWVQMTNITIARRKVKTALPLLLLA